MPRRLPALLLPLLLCPLFATSTPAAGHNGKIIGNQIICFLDGRTIERLLVRNLDTGEVRAVDPDEIPRLVRSTFGEAASASVKGLTPWTTRRLPREIKRLDFNLNSYSDEYRDHFERIVRRLINPERGTSKKPKIRLLSQVIDVDLAGGELRDMVDDGVNLIYIDPDDTGLPVESGDDVFGIASSYWDFETYAFHGADIAFTWRYVEEHFDRMISSIIHEFGHVFGFYHTGWIEDVMSYVRPWWRYEYYWNRSSFIWDTSFLKDKLVYGGRRRADGTYKATVELLPIEGSVIGMEYLQVKVEPEYLGRHVLFITALKGYRNRPMTLSLYRGRDVDESKHIVTIGGYHPRLYQDDHQGLLENYNTSILYFTRQKDFKKLHKAVQRLGKPMEIYGVPYSRVLAVTAVITGYQGAKSATPKTLTRTVRFGYKEPGADW